MTHKTFKPKFSIGAEQYLGVVPSVSRKYCSDHTPLHKNLVGFGVSTERRGGGKEKTVEKVRED